MSQVQIQITKSMIASTDLSSYQFCLVYEVSTGVAQVGAVTTLPCGVLQDAPTALGQDCQVSCGPVEKIVSDITGGAISVGDELGVTTAGKVRKIPTAAGNNVSIGYALEASSETGVKIAVDYHPCYKYHS